MKPEDQAALEAWKNSRPDYYDPDERGAFEAALCHRDAQPAVAQGEPVHFRAVLCSEQQDKGLGVVPKIVGFVDKKAAEQFILEQRDFKGWKYNLEPLYKEAPAVAVNALMLKDAERYRWLRDSKNDPALVIDKRTKWVPEDDSVPGVGGYWEYQYRSDEELDLAIDAAIRAAEAAKGGVPSKCEYAECKHPECGRFYDHNSRGMSCKALAMGACAAKGGAA